jgi:hypothetical protein
MKRFSIKVDEIEQKKKLFVYTKSKPGVSINESDVREKLTTLGYDVGNLKVDNAQGLFVFDIGEGIVKPKSIREKAVENFKPEELNQVDLVLSHAGSDPELAPKEIIDPESIPEEVITPEPKTTRTRKPSTRTRKPRAKKTPTNNGSNQ